MILGRDRDRFHGTLDQLHAFAGRDPKSPATVPGPVPSGTHVTV